MWPFGARHKLIRALDSLAFYNDKGISYSRHTPEQATEERALRTSRIRKLASGMDQRFLPPGFIEALDSGQVATDLTGRYVVLVKEFGRRGAAL